MKWCVVAGSGLCRSFSWLSAFGTGRLLRSAQWPCSMSGPTGAKRAWEKPVRAGHHCKTYYRTRVAAGLNKIRICRLSTKPILQAWIRVCACTSPVTGSNNEVIFVGIWIMWFYSTVHPCIFTAWKEKRQYNGNFVPALSFQLESLPRRHFEAKPSVTSNYSSLYRKWKGALSVSSGFWFFQMQLKYINYQYLIFIIWTSVRDTYLATPWLLKMVAKKKHLHDVNTLMSLPYLWKIKPEPLRCRKDGM